MNQHMYRLRLIIAVMCALALAGCSVNNVKKDESLKKIFDFEGVDGCFALYDNGRGEFTLYNLNRDTTRYLPASTFKIVNSLIAIETGRVRDDSTIIPWDGIVRDYADWNQNLSLATAFKLSSVPHFQQIARWIGRDTMQHWLDTLAYGNHKIGNRVDSFWLDNSLKISPDEQLGLVKKLYFHQLPFQKRSQDIVKNMMLQEANTLYELSYKTGWGHTPDNHALGWTVGWIIENNHPYFFVLNIESVNPQANIPSIRKNVLEKILKQLGFFQGKM